MKKLQKYLNQPYPVSENVWRVIIPISLFVALFIAFFQPFELSAYASKAKIFILLGYGGVTFLMQIFVLIVLPKLFKQFFIENRWTFAKEYFRIILVLFLIGLGNYVYSLQFFNLKGNPIHIFFIFQFFTTIIGIFPVTIVLVLNQNKLLKQNLSGALELSNLLEGKEIDNKVDNQTIILHSESTKDSLQLNPSNLCYASSDGNYVSFFEFVNGELKRAVLRTTLKLVESELNEFDYIFRCHRAFIINMNNIEKVSGNAQGFRLKLKCCNNSILVSRSYVPHFKSKFSINK